MSCLGCGTEYEPIFTRGHPARWDEPGQSDGWECSVCGHWSEDEPEERGASLADDQIKQLKEK